MYLPEYQLEQKQGSKVHHRHVPKKVDEGYIMCSTIINKW